MPPSISFLEEIALALYAKHKRDIVHLTCVCSTTLIGDRFKRCLSPYLTGPENYPRIISFEDWLQALSPLKQTPTFSLIYLLWTTFQKVTHLETSFAQFYPWGSSLMLDFNHIDQYFIEVSHLFTDVHRYKDFISSQHQLTEVQKNALKTFWKFFDTRKSAHQQYLLKRWQEIPNVYHHFQQILQEKGIGYVGLCHKKAYELLRKNNTPEASNPLVFLGINRLTPIEERILLWHQSHLPTSFYWDIDAYYMENEYQEAGHYLRKHRKQPHFKTTFDRHIPNRIIANKKNIKILEVASEVGQITVLETQLKILIKQQGKHFKPNKTAIVVANESLNSMILRMLSSSYPTLAFDVKLNHTLLRTRTYHFVESLVALYDAAESELPTPQLPVDIILTLLQHPYVWGSNPTEVQALITRIRTTERHRIAQDCLKEVPLIAFILHSLHAQNTLLTYLLAILQHTYTYDYKVAHTTLEQTALKQLLLQLEVLQKSLPSTTHQQGVDNVLIKHIASTIKVPLGTHTVEGIHLSNLLDTQSLDFDHVFLIGMNEGHCPPKTNVASFIPHSLRKAYGLPTSEHDQEVIHAYAFYRLLQRAQSMCVIYSTQPTATGQAEMSRYLLQLRYESNLVLNTQVVTYPLYVPKVRPIIITKQGAVSASLQNFLLKENHVAKQLTPSALNTYLDCPLRFYFQYIAKLKVPKRTQEITQPTVFGQLFHKIMERLYAPLVMKNDTPQPLKQGDFTDLHARLTNISQSVINAAVAPDVQGSDTTTVTAIMTKLIRQVLHIDETYAPFYILGVEVGRTIPLYFDFTLDKTKRVRLQGIVDRVDFKSGSVRLVDYKTGIEEQSFHSIDSLFQRSSPKRNKGAFQALLYAWIFHKSNRITSHAIPLPDSQEVPRITPTLFNTRKIFSEDFEPRLHIRQPSTYNDQAVEDIRDYQNEWEENLTSLLKELFDPGVPFSQTEHHTHCMVCPYKGICERY